MNYRVSKGLHILNIGRLCIMWRVRRRRAPSTYHNIRDMPIAAYRPLPGWKDTRAERYGRNAVAAELCVEAMPLLARPSMPKAFQLD